MKRFLLIAAVAVVGCGRAESTVSIDSLGECFSLAAYETIKAEASPTPDGKVECCRKCKAGKVRSGDGLAWVDCPICPDNCPCRAKGTSR